MWLKCILFGAVGSYLLLLGNGLMGIVLVLIYSKDNMQVFFLACCVMLFPFYGYNAVVINYLRKSWKRKFKN